MYISYVVSISFISTPDFMSCISCTRRHGRVSHTLENPLPYGVHAVRMVVRGDHSMLHCHLAVVPPKTETVVFSIDGSFAASVSVTGKDPKVRNTYPVRKIVSDSSLPRLMSTTMRDK